MDFSRLTGSSTLAGTGCTDLQLISSRLTDCQAQMGLIRLLFQKLAWLNFGHNQLEELPTTFGNLVNLVHLDLSGNILSLKSFPKTFFDLVAIERLYLSDNKIERVIPEFGKLASLRILALR